ncbi:MAG: MarR family winged helix-turn-helix transcriptional regulator [Bacteroidia bacterium]
MTEKEKNKTLDFYFRNNWLKISRLYTCVAEEYAVNMSIGNVLLNVDKEGTPSTSLGPRMGMENTSLPRTLKWMEDDGLIYKVQDVKDKRVVKIFLSQKGQEYRKIAREVVLKFNEMMTKDFNPKEVEKITASLARIDEILTEKLKERNGKNGKKEKKKC